MDMAQGAGGAETDEALGSLGTNGADEAGVDDRMFDLGGDERRMHVRAYNHWVSLLKGEPFPAIADLHPAAIEDFGPNSVLLDFQGTIEDPLIVYLGDSLREECGITGEPARIADVPPRSLLSRLTDHYLQIIANRAPIGFEAEFVSNRGRTTLYRGILMPFSSNGEAIDFIYGVISWKELADPLVHATIGAELDAALRAAPAPSSAPVWADGPSGGFDEAAAEENEEAEHSAVSLDAQLMMARESAAAVRAADTRSRSALYRALGRAHDFALAADADPQAYRRLLADAGIKEQARAPLTPVAKLVFGADYDKTRLTEFAAVLGHARDRGVLEGELPEYLSGFAGGIKAVVAEARAARAKPAPKRAPALGDRAALARVALPQTAAAGHLVVLVARVAADGALDVVGQVDDQGVTARAVKALG
jgi:hypothetical protein